MGFPLPGFCFRPTDEEILEYILPRWSAGEALHPSTGHLIRVAKLYGSKEPDRIYADLCIPVDHTGELYFFTLVKKKHCTSSGNCMERVAGIGSWISQNSIHIVDPNTNRFIGYKNTFNFQIKKKNLNSTWIMHEYTLPNSQYQHRFWAFCSIRRSTNGSNKNKRPFLESIPEADVLCVKKRRWTPVSYAPLIGTTSERLKGSDNGDQTEPASHISTPTIDKGTLCTSSVSPPNHGSKDKGKRPLVESTAETDVCIKIHSLSLITTYKERDGASTSYDPTIGAQAPPLQCLSQHQGLHHQTTTALSRIVPEESLHHCGTSRVPGQARVPEYDYMEF